jgi:hypothetical protein
MANPLSNPSARENAPGPTTRVSRKVGGSRKRTPVAATEPSTTRGRAVTSTPDGTQDRHARDVILQDADTVQGQPRTGYGGGVARPITDPEFLRKETGGRS